MVPGGKGGLLSSTKLYCRRQYTAAFTSTIHQLPDSPLHTSQRIVGPQGGFSFPQLHRGIGMVNQIASKVTRESLLSSEGLLLEDEELYKWPSNLIFLTFARPHFSNSIYLDIDFLAYMG